MFSKSLLSTQVEITKNTSYQSRHHHLVFDRFGVAISQTRKLANFIFKNRKD